MVARPLLFRHDTSSIDSNHHRFHHVRSFQLHILYDLHVECYSVYWMAGLSPAASHFFKYLLILSLYSIAMTLYNFLLGTLFQNGGVAILLSALSALYQMTFA